MTESENDQTKFVEEWKIARSVLKEFDEDLHDLRKYGFTFITALLAAESVIIPTTSQTNSETTVLPDTIKLTTFLVNLILIVGLQLLDRNYRVFQKAAAHRATIIERNLNLELTEVIAQRYKSQNVGTIVSFLYVIFVLGVGVLGYVALQPSMELIAILLGATFLAILAIAVLSFSVVTLKYPYGKIDWTLNPIQCNKGEEITITVTNLSEQTIPKKPFPVGTTMWTIEKEEDGTVVKTQKLKHPLSIEEGKSRTWIWKTNDLDDKKTLEDGIYRLNRITLDRTDQTYRDEKGKIKEQLKPLCKKIRIIDTNKKT